MAKQLVVVVPLAVAKDEAGRDVYLYRDTPVPASIPKAERKRLQEGGFVDVVGEDDPTPPPPAGLPGGDQGGGDNPPATVERPGSNGLKAEWVAFAVAQGMDPDAADKATIAELEAAYPAQS